MRALGTAAGGAYLCKAAIADDDGRGAVRAGLARFFAEAFVAGVPALAAGAVAAAPDILAGDGLLTA